MLAHEIADAMSPKPYLDQYGFSDLLRLSPTAVLRRLSFQKTKQNPRDSQKALELLKNRPTLPTWKRGTFSKATALAIQEFEALNQSTRSESGLTPVAATPVRARAGDGQQRPDRGIADGVKTQTRSFGAPGSL